MQQLKIVFQMCFLKSDSYTSVLDWIEKDLPLPMSRPVKICGPKGLGNTLCLLALKSELKSLYSDIEPVVSSSISFKKNEQANTLKYRQAVAQSIGFGTEINSSKTIHNWLSSFVTAREKCQKKVLLFMDFDELGDDNIVEGMCAIVRFWCDYTVLAISSGEGCNTKVQSFLSLDLPFDTLQYLPFTEGEMDRFITLSLLRLWQKDFPSNGDFTKDCRGRLKGTVLL